MVLVVSSKSSLGKPNSKFGRRSASWLTWVYHLARRSIRNTPISGRGVAMCPQDEGRRSGGWSTWRRSYAMIPNYTNEQVFWAVPIIPIILFASSNFESAFACVSSLIWLHNQHQRIRTATSELSAMRRTFGYIYSSVLVAHPPNTFNDPGWCRNFLLEPGRMLFWSISQNVVFSGGFTRSYSGTSGLCELCRERPPWMNGPLQTSRDCLVLL